jgi:hypothetical protein
MQPDILQVPGERRAIPSDTRSFIERVRDYIDALGRPSLPVWARANGPHVLLSLWQGDAFARLTPLGGGQYGLAFRAVEARTTHTNAWEPLLLVDELAQVVEHALVAVDAIAD